MERRTRIDGGITMSAKRRWSNWHHEQIYFQSLQITEERKRRGMVATNRITPPQNGTGALKTDAEVFPVPADQMNLAPLCMKISQVMGDLQRIEKTGYNQYHKYHYATSADVYDAVRAAMSKHKLAFTVSIDTDYPLRLDGWSKGDVITARYKIKLMCGDTGVYEESFWLGQATVSQSTDDKVLNKTATAAVKYFLLSTFLIATGDMPDADEGVPDVPEKKDHWALDRKNRKALVDSFRQLAGDNNTEDKDLWQQMGDLLPDAWTEYETGKSAWDEIKAAYEKLANEKPATTKQPLEDIDQLGTPPTNQTSMFTPPDETGRARMKHDPANGEADPDKVEKAIASGEFPA